MDRKSDFEMTDALYEYILKMNPESDAARGLREETAKLPERGMMTAPEQSRFLAWLVGLLGAKRIVEVGVFTGYTTLLFAEAIPEDGLVTACDVSETFTSIGRPYWEAADVAHKIKLVLAPALETLATIEPGIDFAYIDADKPNYVGYYKRCLELLRPGGVIALDNILWHGRIIDENPDADTAALQAVSKMVREDPHVSMTLVPIGDGVILARKL